ncbi:MAG: Gfo/Idh/MocA family oxidoreductase [Hymenobacter sp.]|nr:MAG: Gfo/Idh/MocA family oxidoreductase [Hymenobacter sp.]
MRTFRWGILGLGNIARKFATDLALVPQAQLHAVASRSLEKARAFAADFAAPHAVGSYAELLAVPGLDVVYVATPHSEHHAHALLCLRAGLPVLCEKAFTLNARQAQELVSTAQTPGIFLMEAFWTRFFPALAKAQELVAAGAIGPVRHLAATFGAEAPYDPEGRLFNPALAGGSLLDIGVYPLFLSKLFLGEPQTVSAAATLAGTGVDMACALALAYADGATASLASTLAAPLDNDCTLYGPRGQLRLLGPVYAPSGVCVQVPGQEPQVYHFDTPGAGYHYEAAHVQHCLARGLTESPLLPLSFSLDLMRLLDRIRQQIGLRYPGE